MTFGSLFAGIGGFDLGLERAGMRCAWQVEVDPRCRSVLARHFPNAKRYDDVREVGGGPLWLRETFRLAPVDVICGGFPCQDLSVAGRRAGLSGARSGLFYELARIVDELRPAWLLWENVPGLLSSNGGLDFLDVLRTLDGVGYGGAWTVLDAQYFGLAQRRRRVFGLFSPRDLGAGRACEVLALAARLRRNPAPSGEAGADVAATPGGGSAGRGYRDNGDSSAALIPQTSFVPDVADPISANEQRTYTHEGRGNFRTRNVVAPDVTAEVDRRFGIPEVAWALQERDAKGVDSDTKDGHLIVFDPTQVTHPDNRSRCDPGAPSHALPESGRPPHIAGTVKSNQGKNSNAANEVEHMSATGVRRLTPRECERLQGFPDDWTALDADGKAVSDSSRYRMLGNAAPPPMVEWIGRRLARVA